MRAHTHNFSSKQRKHRGVAMVLVLSVIAIAAVMGYAMLSSSQVQVQLVENANLMAQAEYAAESGLNVAMMYIQNPEKTPTTPVDISSNFLYGTGPWSFTVSEGTLPSNLTSSASVTVASTATAGVYTVTSVGTAAGPSGATSVSRTLQGQIRCTQYTGAQALDLNTDLNLPNVKPTIRGTIRTTGLVALKSVGGTANFLTTALGQLPTIKSQSMSPTYSGWTAGPTMPPAPTADSIRDYRTYRYQGVTYNATQLTGDINTWDILGPTGSNPCGVYWTNQNININGSSITPLTINGSLIVRGAKLTITGPQVTIQPPAAASGFPALVVDQSITINGANTGLVATWLTVNGLCYAGTGIKTGQASKTNLVFNGPVVLGSGSIDSSYKGTLTLNYDPSASYNAPVKDFKPSTSVVSWTWE